MKQILSNLFIYKYNIQNIHWRMYGADFIDVHHFTDKMYEEINEFIDRIVEKYIQLDQMIDTSIVGLCKGASLKELIVDQITVEEGVKVIVDEGKMILDSIGSVNKEISSLGTMNLILDDLAAYLEKTIWLLSKQIQK